MTPVRMKFAPLWGALAAAFAAAPLAAQEATALDLYRSHVTLSATAIPRTGTDTLGGDFGSYGGFLETTFPLISGAGADPGTPFFRLFGRVRFGADSADLGFLKEKRTFYNAHAGLSAWIRGGEKDSFIVSVSPGFAEDEHTIRNPRLRFGGALLGAHRSSEELLLHYGLVYSYAYGRGRLLPAFGVRWTPERGWVVSALLPVALSVRRRISPSASVGLVAAPLGERVRFANSTEFAGQPSTVNFRLRQYRIGAEAFLRAGPGTSLAFEAGALVARKISFANGDTDFLESSLKSAPYGRLSLRYAFGGETP